MKDVPLSVNFTSIDFVKELHEDERIEDYCEMLSWVVPEFFTDPGFDIEQLGTTEDKNQ